MGYSRKEIKILIDFHRQYGRHVEPAPARCPECFGTGETMHSEPGINNFVFGDCPECGGSGVMPADPDPTPARTVTLSEADAELLVWLLAHLAGTLGDEHAVLRTRCGAIGDDLRAQLTACNCVACQMGDEEACISRETE